MLNIPKEVKDLFNKDSVRKNLRIHFPNGERADITNSNLLAESFSFTESVVSQSEFRFGLCEASMVEFDCFGVENIKGYDIEVSHEIDISSLGEDFIATYGLTSDDVDFPFYSVPYGRFTISEALRQANRQTRRVTAYGKMLEGLKPNKYELAKGNSQFAKNGNYTIYLLKYLYSNVSANSIVPNATYTSSMYENPIYIPLRDTEYGVIANVFYSITYTDDLLRFNSGNLLNNVDEAYVELSEYIKQNIPNLKQVFDEEWNLFLKDSLPSFSFIGGENITNEEIYLYLYAGLPNDSAVGIGILSGISLVDKNRNVLKQVNLRNKEEIKIERVVIDAPKITVSYPLKKGKDGYYYIKDIPYDTFPQLIEEAIELYGKFGKYDRYGNFQMFSINGNNGLVPSKTLVPSATLVPKSLKGGRYDKKQFSSLWYDDFYTLPYDRVSVSYKNADGEDAYAEYWIVDSEAEDYDASKYQAYSLSENTLIQDGTFTEAQIMEILETVAQSLIGLQYMPFEMDAVGLPYLESGDALLVETSEGNIQTLALNRRIDGIQSLSDNINAN